MFHILLHISIPIIFAGLFYPKKVIYVSLILISTMLVDLDHLLATPIYDPLRCSIGFHPLHQYWAILLYFILTYFSKTRLVAIGLIIHMLLDAGDCFL